jgi:hypothetical protein
VWTTPSAGLYTLDEDEDLGYVEYFEEVGSNGIGMPTTPPAGATTPASKKTTTPKKKKTISPKATTPAKTPPATPPTRASPRRTSHSSAKPPPVQKPPGKPGKATPVKDLLQAQVLSEPTGFDDRDNRRDDDLKISWVIMFAWSKLETKRFWVRT